VESDVEDFEGFGVVDSVGMEFGMVERRSEDFRASGDSRPVKG
jgi:hypothetical protein